nr:N-acetylmuramoyl-L-alanine amidase [Epibacterium ulvae]
MPLQRPSPNFGPRRDGLSPHLVVIHYTAMTSADAALERLCDPRYEVSAHYLIGCTGTLWQLVSEEMRAWHAGAGEWGGLGDINSRSIGIELDNPGTHPFPEPQMQALELLLQGILNRWIIPPQGVIGHSDMAPGRKIDPGPRFDWTRLSRQGLAAPSGKHTFTKQPTWEALRTRATQAGYSAPCDDQTLLDTIRLRHRPQATGPLCATDIASLPDA